MLVREFSDPRVEAGIPKQEIKRELLFWQIGLPLQQLL